MGLELVVLAMLALLFTSSLASIGLCAWHAESKKHQFRSALAQVPGYSVGRLVSGDVARPFELDVEVDGRRALVAAVVRGDKALWHVELRGLALPVESRLVVVDKAFRSWCRAARGLAEVPASLGARLTCLAEEPARAPAPDPADLARMLDGPGRPLATIIDRERVFVEAPRGRSELSVPELVRVVARARGVVAVVEGRSPQALPPARTLDELPVPHASIEAPSGIPVLVPWPER